MIRRTVIKWLFIVAVLYMVLYPVSELTGVILSYYIDHPEPQYLAELGIIWLPYIGIVLLLNWAFEDYRIK